MKTINKSTTRVGFIGLGLMGSRFTRRLHASGWKVRAWNRNGDISQALSQEGIAITDSVVTLINGADVVFSSLANDAAVHAVYFNEGGVFSVAKPGTILLEMSTISPELSRELHREADLRQLYLLDLAVSGSTPAVEAGTVTLLAGGDPGIFEQCTPLYSTIAKQWFLIGPGSSGILMKLVVNLLLGLNMQAIAEAVSLGEHLHIDRNTLLDVLSKSAVIAPAMLGKFQKIKEHDYASQFPLRLMSKDLDLVMQAAVSAGANLPATKVAQSIFSTLLPESGDLDLSAITPYVVDGLKE